MPGPALNSVLLLRRVRPSLAGPDLFRITENYYDRAQRAAASFTMPDSLDGNEYSRPVTDVVDRYCDAQGVAPFTQTTAYHNGTGNITTTSVNGVTACQLAPCQLTLTLTASAVINGRGLLLATANFATGAILFSLDNFQTAGRPPSPGGSFVEFERLRPGRYTVTVRESRLNGCTATASITITVTYGPRYEVPFKDADNVACLLRVSEREYTGQVESLLAQPSPVVIDYPGTGPHFFDNLLRGSQCQLALYLTRPDQLLPLFSGDERLHRVDYTRAGALVWTGYLLPEQYDVQFLAPPTTFNLAATDGLGTLSDLPFLGSAGEALRGDWTLVNVLLHCLGKLDLGLPLNVLLNLFPSTALLDKPAVEQIRFDVATYRDEKGKPFSCGKVLTSLLDAFQARLYQQDGAWWLERLAELDVAGLSYASYNANGTPRTPTTRTLLATVLPPTATSGGLYWRDATQHQSLRPAVARVTVEADPGEPVNLLAFAVPVPANVPSAALVTVPPGWTSAPALNPAPYSSLIYQGPTKAPLLRLVGTTANFSTPAAAALAPTRAAWVQTPDTSPVPIGGGGGGLGRNYLVLRFTAKPINVTTVPFTTVYPRLMVAVRIGGVWVRSNGQESPTPIYEELDFNDDKEQTIDMLFGRQNQALVQRQAVAVRFVGPLGGGTACTVDITNIRLIWGNEDVPGYSERYATVFTGDTGSLVSRTDEALALTVADTPLVRRAGTPLDLLGRPVAGWQEPEASGQLRALGDYLVRDRMLWQRGPAQVLTGLLHGTLGPGALLTDPDETRPGVYALTAATLNAEAATWQVNAVQMLTITAPAAPFPDNAIALDDDTVWADEDGRILTYDTI